MVSSLFWLGELASEIAGTIAGFGSSTLFLPISLFFLDFQTALVLVAIFHVFGNLGRITFFRHGFDKRLMMIFGLPAVVFTIVGALLVNSIPQVTLKFILGIFLLLYSITMLFKPSVSFPATKKNSVIGGSISGFLAGLIGTGGALRGAFLTAFNLKKEVYIATSAAIALAVDLTRIPIYISGGFLPQEFYYFIPILFLLAISGSFIGRKIVDRIPQARFKRLVLAAIALVSLKFIADGLVL